MFRTTPIGSGGQLLRSLDFDGVEVDETRYPGALELERHAHEHHNLCFVLDGALTEEIGRHRADCDRSTLIVKPAGEVHRDRFHRGGARCLNIELAGTILERVNEYLPGFGAPWFRRAESINDIARRIHLELANPDDATPLVVEGCVLELAAHTVRAGRTAERRPSWLRAAEDYLRAHFRQRVGLAEVAAAIGRHPVHVAQQFRRHYRCSVGDFVRRQRVEYVARELGEGHASLAEIAANAGFFDQSHMHRVFKRHTGMTPATYRRERPRLT